MKAFVIAGKRDVYFEDRPAPLLKHAHSVLVKVMSAGICGTDVHIYEGEHLASQGQLRVPGHEFAGVVVQVGTGVERLKPGDRVVHEPIAYCGRCYACRHGQGNVCREVRVTGCNINGGWQEFYVADEQQWHVIPDWMSWNQAALVEPYTIASQVCLRSRVAADDTVLVLGGGPIGLMCADTAKRFGAKVVLSEILDKRLELARGVGVDLAVNPVETDMRAAVMDYTKGEGPNVVLDCAGVPAFPALAVDLLSPAGRFVPVAPGPMSLDNGRAVMVKQLEIIGSRLQMGQFAPVIARFALYAENASRMITDVFPFAESDKAFAYAASRDPGIGKVVVRFDE